MTEQGEAEVSLDEPAATSGLTESGADEQAMGGSVTGGSMGSAGDAGDSGPTVDLDEAEQQIAEWREDDQALLGEAAELSPTSGDGPSEASPAGADGPPAEADGSLAEADGSLAGVDGPPASPEEVDLAELEKEAEALLRQTEGTTPEPTSAEAE